MNKPAAPADSPALPIEENIEVIPAAQRQLGGKLAGLTLPQQVAVLAIWPLLEQVLNFLVGFVDTALAGRISTETVNAIGVATYFGWLIGLVQSAVGIGATAVISRAVGGRHKRVANAALGQAVLLAIMMGTFIGVLLFILAPSITAFANLKGTSAAQCVTYLRIISPGAFLSAVLFVGSACLRGAGDTRTPFLVLVIVNVVNTALSIYFVWQMDMGVAGIAWGTTIAWAVGAIVTSAVLIGGWGGIRLRWHRLRPHWHTMKRVIRIGVPSLVEMFLAMWLANFLILRIVGMLGDDVAWGVHIIGIRIEAISFMPGFAMGIAASTLVGQYLGLGDVKRARQAVYLCWGVAAAIMTVMGAVFWLFPEPLVRTITDKPELLSKAPTLLRICAPVQVFFATSIVLGNAIRGAGDTRASLWMTAFSTYVIRLPLVFFVGYLYFGTLWGVWIGLCAEIAFRGCLFAFRFWQGKWETIKV
jgi:putative MATE family efflux protein